MENIKTERSVCELLLSYIIFGTIGLFVRFIPLPSSAIATFRGIAGAVVIFLFLLMQKKVPNFKAIKQNGLLLLISGTAIGFNWILLFEAYRYTTVATATLCYYMAPVFVIIASFVFLRESFSVLKAVCVAFSLIGMILQSGVLKTGFQGSLGIVFGLSAAILYAVGIICNKLMKDIEGTDRALIQLLIAGLSVLPYVLLTEEVQNFTTDTRGAVLLIIIGVVHTGFAYVINLGAIGRLPAQTAAALSYTDPVVAIALSALILNEIPDIFGIIGGILILGSTLIASLQGNPIKK